MISILKVEKDSPKRKSQHTPSLLALQGSPRVRKWPLHTTTAISRAPDVLLPQILMLTTHFTDEETEVQ